MFGLLFATSMLSLGLAEDVKPKFRMVGLYDASSVLGVSKKRSGDFLWRPSKLMEKSCGPSKGPDALGMFEAEIVGNQQAPSLTILLEHNVPASYLDPEGKECDPKIQQPCDPIPRGVVTPQDVSVGLGVGKIDFQLHPMVQPRYLAVEIDGYVEQEIKQDQSKNEKIGLFDTTRYQKLIRTQLEIELCLEHKVGRGWTGNDQGRLRQAFLLDPPDGDRPDRKFYNGQRDPIPALVGPSDACITSKVEIPKDALASKGESSMTMTPSDVWGASLRSCTKGLEQGGLPVASPPKSLPLSVSQNNIRMPIAQRKKWAGLHIEVEARGNEEKDVFIKVKYKGEPVPGLEEARLFPMADKTDDPRKKGAMLDILARLTHSYPTIGTKEDPERYVALMVPNWQIVEGLRRLYSRDCIDENVEKYCRCTIRSFDIPLGDENAKLETRLDEMDKRLRCLDLDKEQCTLSRVVRPGKEKSAAQVCLEKLDVDKPMPSGGSGIYDGVGWILEHAEFLFVQVDSMADPKEGFQVLDYFKSGEDNTGSSESQKPNLTGVVKGPGKLSPRDWGYTVGLMSARSPIVTPSKERVDWEISAKTQRSVQQSYFSVGVFVLIGFVVVGFRRWPDFWTRTPEERAYYWPGRQASNEQPEAESADLESAGGGKGDAAE